MSAYILRERVSSKFFIRMTGIGPMLGTEAEAMRFESERDARQNPAMWYPLTVMEPVETSNTEGRSK